jgi:hypothetical protein
MNSSKWNMMISELSDNYEKLLLKSLKEKNLIEKTDSNLPRKTLLEYDENSWYALLNDQNDSQMRNAIDNLLDYTKQPIIEKKKLNELRERSMTDNNWNFSLKTNGLGIQHSSSKSMTQSDVNLDEKNTSLVNDEKGWSVSPIKNNQISYSEMSTINKINASQSRSNNSSPAGILNFARRHFLFLF